MSEYDVLFWWTGWATWLVISLALALLTAFGALVIVVRAWRGLKAWSGIHIIRNSIDNGDWNAVDRWPKIHDEEKSKIVMDWLRAVADSERKQKGA